MKGGAERHAWEISKNLDLRGIDVTVLTTCSEQFLSDWSLNYYEAGEYFEEGIRILRFPVKKQNATKFHQANAKLLSMNNQKEKLILGLPELDSKEEEIYFAENINSPALSEFLERNYTTYDAFIFLPYLFPTTVQGVKIVRDKSILQPCLHDESYAYLCSIQQTFLNANRIVYISEGEYELAMSLYSNAIENKSIIAGAGVDIELETLANYSEPPRVDRDYLLCLGRRDIGKNTHLLIKAFDNYYAKCGSNLKLVIAGPGDLPVRPNTTGIIDLGLVSDSDKINLLKNCTALVNPSTNESFSRVIFESWIAGKPVVVHSQCLATLKALEASGFAGWHADDATSFSDVFEKIENTPREVLVALGEQGNKYALQMTDWNNVIDKYISIIKQMVEENREIAMSDDKSPGRGSTDVIFGKNAIIILLENIYPFDAVGIDAIAQYECLIKEHCEAYLFGTKNTDASINPYTIAKSDLYKVIKQKSTLIIYHYSSYCEIAEKILKSAKCKIVLKYHNITPSAFFRNYSKKMSDITELGRKRIKRLIKNRQVHHYLADSEFNASELIDYGVQSGQLSIIAPFNRMQDFDNTAVNTELADGLSKEGPTILFVGRIAPNKGLKHLISVISEYVKMYDRDIQLNIVGDISPNFVTYFNEVDYLIKQKALQDVVFIRKKVSFQDLHTYYTHSDLFLLMSEHEGFCVPILEAQYHELPIIALDRSAVRTTLGPNQLIFETIDYPTIAAAIHVITHNSAMSLFLAKKGLRNLRKYNQETLEEKFLSTVSQLTYVNSTNDMKVMKNSQISQITQHLPPGETEISILDYLSGFKLEDAPEIEMQNYLNQDYKRFILTLGLIPADSGNLLEIGANPYFMSLLIEKFLNYKLFFTNHFIDGHPVEEANQYVIKKATGAKTEYRYMHFNIENEMPFEDNKFDIVLFCEVIEHLKFDPINALLNIKKCLKKGGYLILTTPNVSRLENIAKMIEGQNIYDPYSAYGIYGRHNREYTKHELFLLLTQLGFEVEVIFSSDVHEVRNSIHTKMVKIILNLAKRFIKGMKNREHDLGQYNFIRARNVSEPNQLRPRWLYRSYDEDEMCD